MGPSPSVLICNAGLNEAYEVQRVRKGEVRPLGIGAYSEVWPASHRASGQMRVAKSMPKSKTSRAEMNMEVELLRSLSHRNVIQVFDVFEDWSSYHVILEYCKGNLGDRIESSSLDEKSIGKWAYAMLEAVRYLHAEQICHRDVKPDNFLLDGKQVLKLADFGIALRLEEGKTLKAKMGTPLFMAPEQHRLPEGQGYAHPVDCWACGITIYLMTNSGKHPFRDEKNGGLLLGNLMKAKFQEGLKDRIFARGSDSGDLVKRLLMPHHSQRISAKLAKGHPWFVSMDVCPAEDKATMPKLEPKIVPIGRDGWISEDQLENP